jgi:hypothetical protein
MLKVSFILAGCESVQLGELVKEGEQGASS